jgi:putative hydrolase of the HAD superfamily
MWRGHRRTPKQSNMGIKAVLFDAVGTLIRPDPPVAQAYHEVGRRFGSSLTIEQISARFSAVFTERERAAANGTAHRASSQSAERARWQRVVAEVFDDLPDASGPFETLWNHFAQPRNWRLYDDAAQTWHKLEQAGCMVGIASNFDDRLQSVCRGLPPLDLCDRLFWSARLGHAKPSPKFFAKVEYELGLSPPEIVLVGDDYANDYLGATAAGWRAIHLDRCISNPNAPAAVIRSLAELPALLSAPSHD